LKSDRLYKAGIHGDFPPKLLVEPAVVQFLLNLQIDVSGMR
jgi:hypothetical protein